MNKTKLMVLVTVLILVGFAAGTSWAEDSKQSYKPKAGYVPDEKTAIKIAEAVWLPIYGESIYNERPFKAQLVNGVWIVRGTLPEGWIGGTAVAEISQETGCILRVIHEE